MAPQRFFGFRKLRFADLGQFVLDQALVRKTEAPKGASFHKAHVSAVTLSLTSLAREQQLSPWLPEASSCTLGALGFLPQDLGTAMMESDQGG